MTQSSCIAFCYGKQSPYAGIGYRQECCCGLIIGAGSDGEDDCEYISRCPGVAKEAGGFINRLTVFYTELLNLTRTNPGPPNTSHIGSITDDMDVRTLAIANFSDGVTT